MRGSRLTKHHLIGLGFWQGWQMAAMCTDAVVPSAGDPLNLKTLIIAVTTLGYLVVMALSRLSLAAPPRRSLILAAGFCMSLGTFAMLYVPHIVDPPLQTIALIFSLLAIAAGNAVLLFLWGSLWSTLATGRVGQHLYLSYAFAFVLFFAVCALPSPLNGLFVCVFPMLSCAILKSCENEPRRRHSGALAEISPTLLAAVLVFVFVLSVVWGLTQKVVPSIAAQDAFFMEKGMLVAGVAIGALALNMTLTSPESESIALYHPVVPTMAAGIIMLAVAPPEWAFVGNGLVTMGIYCLDMFIMLTATDLAFRTGKPTVLVFGAGILMARIGTTLGTVGMSLSGASLEWGSSFSAFALLCVGALVLASSLVFSRFDLQRLYEVPVALSNGQGEGEGEGDDSPGAAQTLSQRCESVALQAGLTARETEVLELLLRGRTVQGVCDELVIAQGTAKHHVSNIYRKLGVGDRRSLHDTVERMA